MSSIKVAFKDLPKSAIYKELVQTSGCRVICPRTTGEPLNLQIEFSGALLQLPSNNDKRPFKAGRFTVVDWHKEAAARLQAMTFLFTKATMQAGILPPSFGETPVHIQILLGHRKGRWDCHNTPKAVCDWLEDVKVIDNDSRAQCWATKASWFDLPQDRTTITITALSLLS